MAQTPDGSGNGERPARRRGALPLRVVHWSFDALYAGLVSAMPLYAAGRAAGDPKARSRWAAYARDISARFGRRQARTSNGPCVWVHGVSVGEVKAAARLVTEIERSVPGVEVVISVTTDTGFRVARKRYPGHRVEFYPPDLSWIVLDSLDAIRPDLMILVESEFWPNFLFAARDRGIPVALVNGKMSKRSAKRFGALPAVTRRLLDCIEILCVQLPLHEERFRALGVPAERIHVTGNMKFDNIPIKQDQVRDDEFVRLLGADDGLPIVVAGSTHPNEERTLARISRRLTESGMKHRLVVAPRHPARADTVEADMRREGGDVVRRSRMGAEGRPSDGQIVLLDTVGELERVYARADVVFVGGSLVRHGGQNMMEPASLGKPVVVGRYVHNFRGEVEMLKHVDGIVVERDAEGVEATLRSWLADPASASEIGHRARDVIERSKGATSRTLEKLRPLLERVARPTAR
ncbi:MAG: 3-deoxy-D-manno-octulosonic acid transferase [Planctomycetota bacterium]|nr:3-deoxy-D-manno-octulosonic acid transferase [Planctomycetota bacterium]